MDVWGWGSPVGWAVFLVACGATVALLGWGLNALAKAVERFVALPVDKK
jgi:hypothetical protein